MDQAGISSASSAPLPGTFLGLALDIRSDKLYDLVHDIPDVMGLRALRPNTAIVKVMSVHCGKYIQQNLGKHIALYHMELAQLWRCPVMWCTVWKGTAQDCIDHLRRTHDAPQVVNAANLARYFPPWTVTREQWSEMTRPTISGVAIDTLLFSRIGVPLFHRYRIISRSGTHAAFRGTYMLRLHTFLEELDAESVRRQHRRCGKELVARMSQSSGRDSQLFLLDAQSLVGQSPGPETSQASVGGRVF